MVEPDVARFEIPTELLHEAQQAYTDYRGVLAQRPEFVTHADAVSAKHQRELAAARRRVAAAYTRLSVACVDTDVLFIAFHRQARRYERDAAADDAYADSLTGQAADGGASA